MLPSFETTTQALVSWYKDTRDTTLYNNHNPKYCMLTNTKQDFIQA